MPNARGGSILLCMYACVYVCVYTSDPIILNHFIRLYY